MMDKGDRKVKGAAAPIANAGEGNLIGAIGTLGMIEGVHTGMGADTGIGMRGINTGVGGS